MKAFLFVAATLFVFNLWAQKKDFGLPPTDLRPGSLHQGDLFTIKMVPGDKETSFYVVGKKAGAVKIDGIKMEAVFDVGGEKTRVSLIRRADAFILPKKMDKDLELELRGEAPGEVEKVKIKYKP